MNNNEASNDSIQHLLITMYHRLFSALHIYRLISSSHFIFSHVMRRPRNWLHTLLKVTELVNDGARIRTQFGTSQYSQLFRTSIWGKLNNHFLNKHLFSSLSVPSSVKSVRDTELSVLRTGAWSNALLADGLIGSGWLVCCTKKTLTLHSHWRESSVIN